MSENLSQSSKNREKIMAVATGGICLALAEVLSILKLYEMPQGGSVTLASMLPIILFALCFGPAWGLGVAFLYSIMQVMIGGYIMAPAQVLCDYTLAFTVLGTAGFFAAKRSLRTQESNILRRLRLIPYWKLVLATVAAMSGRLVFSFISGIVFYASYAPEGQAVWIYSLAYNGTYLIPEAIITLVVLFAMLETLRFHPVVPDTNSLTLGDWLISFIISIVPIFGQVTLIVWAFDANTKPSKRTWAQAMLIVLGVLGAAWLTASIIQGAPVVKIG